MRRWGLVIAGVFASAFLFANTYTVTTTADSGAGSLRQAILDANANGGADTIAFAIVGTAPHTIALASALPNITDAVTINGYTQAGSSPNTQPTGQGLNTLLMIVIDGAGSGVPGTLGCMTSTASNVTIRGLCMNRCPGYQIRLEGAVSSNVVAGNFLGTTYDGLSVPAGASAGGVLQVSQTGTRIGGTAPADRNLIAGVSNPLWIGATGVAGADVVVEGNLLGTDATGLVSLAPLTGTGVDVGGGHGVRIGGPTASSRNVISRFQVGMYIASAFGDSTSDVVVQGNFVGTDVTGTRLLPAAAGGQGIVTSTADNFEILGNTIGGFGTGIETQTAGQVIRGNFIGTDSTGTHDLGNTVRGIRFAFADDMLIGGVGAGQGNWIAFNSMAGVEGQSGSATIRGNRIWNNKTIVTGNGLGIDLTQNSVLGVTINDPGDADTGPNDLQNFPFLTSTGPALAEGNGGTHIEGFLDSAPSTQYTIDFYSSPACAPRPQELPEGQDYIGTTQVTTDGSGHVEIDVTLPASVEAGARITATATDPAGNTSEFSPRIVFSMFAGSGVPAGGTNVTIAGMMFEDGATVTIGGVAAGNVDVVSPTQVTATTPALPAGSVNHVVVTNPSGISGTLPNGWIADFADVGGSQFYNQITQLVANAITVGCGGGNYCPLNPVTRQQMAVFLLKSKHGVCYVPPPCSGTVFDDVTCSSTFDPWIEALAASGVTGGCGGGNYCPTNPVLRQQMAVFLLKAKHDSSFVPPPCDGDFGDVDCPGNPFADWIEELAAQGITGGCGGGNYCPLQSVRRDQMAAFLVKTFQLP